MSKFLLTIVSAAILFAFVPASAEHIKRQGGHTVAAQKGPWIISKEYFEDGSRVCWGANLNHGRSTPWFMYAVRRSREGSNSSSIRFQAHRSPADNETVQLIIGTETFVLTHPKGYVAPVFFPKTHEASRRITTLLEKRQGASDRSFRVVDRHGGNFKYCARSTTEMLNWMERHCGFERF